MEDKKEKDPRGRKTNLVVLFKDDEPLTFVGTFVNPSHLQHATGFDCGNINKYFKGLINTFYDHIPVLVEAGNMPLESNSIEQLGRQKAKERQERQRVLKLTEKQLSKLSIDKVRRIQAIIDEEEGSVSHA